MAEIIKDEIQDTHYKYDEYHHTTYRQTLELNDQVELRINDKIIKSFIVKYINAHVHLTYQDKGEKKLEEI